MFSREEVIQRSAIHDQYGGSRQSGISTPAKHPLIFLFSGETGRQYGYHDEISEGVFRYTGEGQIGDMVFTKGNAAIRDHVENGKSLQLFEYVRKGWVRYLGEMICGGYEIVPGVPDRASTLRNVIVFHLIPNALEDLATPEPGLLQPDLSLEDLRRLALSVPDETAVGESTRNVYVRSQAVRQYVLRRSQGICEACGSAAPFITPSGDPYLEPHHLRRVADGGPDHPTWVAAVCPNCHRRCHSGRDRTEFNQALVERVFTLEN